eukprot:scaffold97460_cov36-Phaeocystis_antarctica.AAC.1
MVAEVSVHVHGRAARDEVHRVLGAEDKWVFVPEARRALEKHQCAGARPSLHLVVCGLRVGLESEVERGVAGALLSCRHRRDVRERELSVSGRAEEEESEPTHVVTLHSAAHVPEPALLLGPRWKVLRELYVGQGAKGRVRVQKRVERGIRCEWREVMVKRGGGGVVDGL